MINFDRIMAYKSPTRRQSTPPCVCYLKKISKIRGGGRFDKFSKKIIYVQRSDICSKRFYGKMLIEKTPESILKYDCILQ